MGVGTKNVIGRSISGISIEKRKRYGSFMENQQEIREVEGEDLSTHLNEGYVVRVHFSKDDYSATDALKHYLKQMAELKF